MKIDRVRLIESYRHPTAPTNGIVPFDYICCLAFRMSSKPNSIPQNIEIYIDRFKEETFTLPEPTEEINPNPTSPDTPQISDPVPSSSVRQPTLSSSQPCPDSPPGPPTPIHIPCLPVPLHFILLKLKELLHPPDLK